MEGIRDKVAIIGAGCTKFGERWDVGVEDLLIEAVYEAFEDAGVEPKEIQAAWIGTSQSGARGETLSYPLKLEYIPVTRVENACATGTEAFRGACYAVAAGVYDIALAVGVEKTKDTGFAGLAETRPSTGTWTEPSLPPPVQFALMATRYFHHYNISYEEGKRILAMISVKNHHNGLLSPKAHLRREITLEQAINAPMIVWPLGLYDCCGVSDGAAAAIITRPDLARSFRDDYILVKGLGVSVGAAQFTLQDDYDWVHIAENVEVARRSYAEAGIKNPREEIDVAEVHDCFSIHELLIYEDLGFSLPGKAREDVEAGFFTMEGKLPVNVDGGLKSFGHPVGASGLRMIYEVYKQLQEKAGARQVKNARLGLTHNLGGRVGKYACAMAILGRKE